MLLKSYKLKSGKNYRNVGEDMVKWAFSNDASRSMGCQCVQKVLYNRIKKVRVYICSRIIGEYLPHISSETFMFLRHISLVISLGDSSGGVTFSESSQYFQFYKACYVNISIWKVFKAFFCSNTLFKRYSSYSISFKHVV